MTIQNKLKELLKNKRALVLMGIVILVVLLLILMVTKSTQIQPVSPADQPYNDMELRESRAVGLPQPTLTLTATQKVALQQAINSQKAVDDEYAGLQLEVKQNYPWLRKLPLASQRYFVYFDIDKKTFIGKLYLSKSDDGQKLKTELVNRLRNVLEIPVENFLFEWIVIPQ